MVIRNLRYALAFLVGAFFFANAPSAKAALVAEGPFTLSQLQSAGGVTITIPEVAEGSGTEDVHVALLNLPAGVQFLPGVVGTVVLADGTSTACSAPPFGANCSDSATATNAGPLAGPPTQLLFASDNVATADQAQIPVGSILSTIVENTTAGNNIVFPLNNGGAIIANFLSDNDSPTGQNDVVTLSFVPSVPVPAAPSWAIAFLVLLLAGTGIVAVRQIRPAAKLS
jgi:hypothetical protein